jgi:acetyl-CoA decarbonylase/synthase complex subunit gamma
MALTGMDIFKLLPKTNCRECGLPTCIAFAMSLASRKIELSACPYLSDEAKAQLAAADAPPIKTVQIGDGNRAIKIGGESVMFRHEKRFNHPTGLALLFPDTLSDEEADDKLLRFRKLRYCRMGMDMGMELAAVKNESQESGKFIAMIEKVMQQSDAPLILMGEDPEVMSEALDRYGQKKPLVYAATTENADEMARLAVAHACPLAAKADDLEALAALSKGLTGAGVEMLVLDPGDRAPQQALFNQVHIRRAAIYQDISSLGFPTIAFPCETAGNMDVETLIAAMFIAKYAGIVVLSDVRGESLFPLLLERAALFTDPETPPMVPAGVHEIGNPLRNAPVLLASSWALTYYNIILAVEAARTPLFLCFEQINEPDVMCWCRHCLRSTQKGDFNANGTAQFIRDCKLEERVDHRKLVISERNAPLKGALEKALPEWEVVVGPDRADRLYGFLPGFAKELAAQCKKA